MCRMQKYSNLVCVVYWYIYVLICRKEGISILFCYLCCQRFKYNSLPNSYIYCNFVVFMIVVASDETKLSKNVSLVGYSILKIGLAFLC